MTSPLPLQTLDPALFARAQALLDEDRIIAKWPLAMRKADIRIVKDTEVFE